MRWIVLAIALLFSTGASAQCSGIFPNNYMCGNNSGASNVPSPIPFNTFTSAQIDTVCATNNDSLIRLAGLWQCMAYSAQFSVGSTLSIASLAYSLLTGAPAVRIQLTGTASYYVNANSGGTSPCGSTGALTCSAGSDSNNCLTPGTACLTMQHVINLVLNNVDFAGFTGTIFPAHGSSTNYNFTCTAGPFIGQSVLSIQGDTSAKTAVTIVGPSGGPAVQVKDGCTIGIDSIAFADAGTNDTTQFIIAGVGNYGHVDGSNLTFGPMAIGKALAASYGGSITLNGTNNVTGSMNAILSVANGGAIEIDGTINGSAGITWGGSGVVIGSGGALAGITTGTFTGFSGVSGPRCFISNTTSPDGFNPNKLYPGSSDCVVDITVGAMGLQNGSGAGSSLDYGTQYAPHLSGGGSSAKNTWGGPVVQLSAVTFANLASPQVLGMIAVILDGKASNCGDSACTTWGTTVTGGTGALKLHIWNNGSTWTLLGK